MSPCTLVVSLSNHELVLDEYTLSEPLTLRQAQDER
jgi:hypothetical protein